MNREEVDTTVGALISGNIDNKILAKNHRLANKTILDYIDYSKPRIKLPANVQSVTIEPLLLGYVLINSSEAGILSIGTTPGDINVMEESEMRAGENIYSIMRNFKQPTDLYFNGISAFITEIEIIKLA